MNTGDDNSVKALDICIYRTVVNLVVNALMVKYYGKRYFADVPKHLIGVLVARSIFGTCDFFFLMIAVMYLPLTV